MITNRTSEDVALAKTLGLKLRAKQSLTETETAQFLRGTCTNDMINRINTKAVSLKAILDSMSYYVEQLKNTTNKTDTQILSKSEYDDIFLNVNKVRNAFFTYSTTPNTPTYLYGYKEANDIEKVLVDIESMIPDMTGKYRQCGTFQCGEENTN